MGVTTIRKAGQGLLSVSRTAGGHRKLRIAEVLKFVREHDRMLDHPEILGLPPASTHSGLALRRAVELLVDSLLSGDELLARQVIVDLYLAEHPLSVICDRVIAAAFQEIGERWACQQADVYQERRGCELMVRILLELRRLLPPPNGQWIAIGGAPAGDQYVIPSTMAELVLRENLWQATSLGTSIPLSSFCRSIREVRPQLFWLSVSFISDPAQFLQEFAEVSHACAECSVPLAVGGRALVPELRTQMTYSTFCDTMQQLASFAATLRDQANRSGRRRTTKS